jgi:3-oxo-5alpha-steroid 4-dehydrogenase
MNEAPLVLSDPSTAEWFAQADVVVAGAGGAGISAALQAREEGGTVIAIDRFRGGGSTAWSGGIWYGCATPYQREAGVEDTPEAMFAYLQRELRGSVSDTTLRKFCAGSAAEIDWLTRQGVRFNSRLTEAKTYYPSRGYYLYYSGNERLKEYAEFAKPAPRGHRAYDEPDPVGNTGYAFYRPLEKKALETGVRLIRHAAVKRLVTDSQGRVIGVEALVIEDPAAQKRHAELYDASMPAPFNDRAIAKALVAAREIENRSGRRRLVRARGGVILSAGGFELNTQMLSQASNTDYSKTLPLGMLGSDGSGISLGRSVGGATSHMHRAFIGMRLSPPVAFVKGMLIGRAGTRMISEEAYLATIGTVMAEKSNGAGWIILDGSLLRSALRDALPDRAPNRKYGMATLLNILIGGTRRSRTIEGLARKLGLDAIAMRRTLDTYNRAARGEVADEFDKPISYLHGMERGPYYAVNVSISNRLQFASVFTLGGLRVHEESGAVLREDQTAIDGLFAAGRNAAGLPSESYISGMSLADCVFSGRRAARAALARARSEASPAAPRQLAPSGSR